MKTFMKIFLMITMVATIPMDCLGADIKEVVMCYSKTNQNNDKQIDNIFVEYTSTKKDEIYHCGYTSSYGNYLAGHKRRECYKKSESKKWKDATENIIKSNAQGISFRAKSENVTRHFVCCNGNLTGTPGYWVEVTNTQNAHPTWGMYRAEENRPVTDGCPSGQYKVVYKNVCGGETVVSECSSCPAGQQMRNGTCAPICPDGQAYESTSSNKCVDCAQTTNRGVKKDGTCVSCSTTQFYSPARQDCVNFADMIQVSSLAHDACWLCASPGAMLKCMIDVVKNGDFSKLDKGLQTACGLSGAGAENYKLPDDWGVSEGN